MNPFDLTGPPFLALYLFVLAVAVVTAFVLRWLLRAPIDDPPVEAGDLSPYEIAYLAGGERAAIDAAIVRLVQRNVLQLDWNTGKLSRRGDGALTDAHPLEKMVDDAAGIEPGRPLAQVRAAAHGTARKLRDRLETLGLLVQPAQASNVCLASAGVVFLAWLFGAIKFFVGIARQANVGFLVMLLIATAVIGIVFAVKRPFRSRRGDTLLDELKHDNAALRYAAGQRVTELGDADLVLATGLFGVAVLSGGPLGRLQASLRSPAGLSKANSSTSGSSCSSSTCGSSCGGGGGGGCGGGCGGGGCGGCGG